MKNNQKPESLNALQFKFPLDNSRKTVTGVSDCHSLHWTLCNHRANELRLPQRPTKRRTMRLFLTRIKAEAEVIEIENKPITLRLLPPSCPHNSNSSTGNCFSPLCQSALDSSPLKLHLLLAEILLREGHHTLNERRWVFGWSSLSISIFMNTNSDLQRVDKREDPHT